MKNSKLIRFFFKKRSLNKKILLKTKIIKNFIRVPLCFHFLALELQSKYTLYLKIKIIKEMFPYKPGATIISLF